MQARIYKLPKNAMQSGKALTEKWALDFAPLQAKRADPLMGWTGSGDTQQQVQLKFATSEAAQAYAEKHGIDAQVRVTPAKTLKIQTYADNFG